MHSIDPFATDVHLKSRAIAVLRRDIAREETRIREEEEEKARARSGGMGSFLSAEQKKVFTGAGGIEERIRRGRAGLVVDAD